MKPQISVGKREEVLLVVGATVLVEKVLDGLGVETGAGLDSAGSFMPVGRTMVGSALVKLPGVGKVSEGRLMLGTVIEGSTNPGTEGVGSPLEAVSMGCFWGEPGIRTSGLVR